MPGGINPASAVTKYKESPPEIEFLTLPQVKEQLDLLAEHKQMQTMVAMLIYAGLRREDLHHQSAPAEQRNDVVHDARLRHRPHEQTLTDGKMTFTVRA
jgi:hypothetical protein